MTKFVFSCGFGNIIAAFISWKLYHSVGWAIIHFLLGWIYVAYYLVMRFV